MKQEQIVRVGEDGSLIGIISEPEVRSPSAPAFLLLNAGLLHRVGPARVYVNLARALAQRGFVCVRFDVSGLGDSAFRSDNLTYHESRIVDAQSMMQVLESDFGIGRFVLVGICSGADHAFRVACADRRACGAILVDAYTYPTTKRAIHYYSRRLFRAEPWLNLVTGRHPVWRRLARRTHLMAPDTRLADSTEFVVDAPPREEAESHISALLARQVALFFLYTASVGSAYTYPSQFYDMFENISGDDKLRAEYWPEIDHVFTRLSHQSRFVTAALNWSVDRWPTA